MEQSFMVQVNLFQKLATSAEHVVYQNCSECQNKTKTTICVHKLFCRYSELTIFMNNEQSVLILWVSWCKNKRFLTKIYLYLLYFLMISDHYIKTCFNFQFMLLLNLFHIIFSNLNLKLLLVINPGALQLL